MGSIFNEKVAKKWSLWVREQCMGTIHERLGQQLRLGKKKEKMRAWKTQMPIKSDPNRTLV